MPKKNAFGGKAIDAGGFGCVFKPALKCEGNPDRQPDHVSKLMIKKYADDEMAEINKFLPIITTIPNNANYFIISGISQCQPDLLETSDLDEFDDKCKNLVKKGYSASNINTKLKELGMLNIVDGGISVKNYSTKTDGFDEEFFHLMNKSLIKLLTHGVIEMNKRNLFHGDLKADNILIKAKSDGTGLYARIIDWGLANVLTNNNIFYHRPLQFNIPLGSILLSNEFLRFFKTQLESYESIAGVGIPPTDAIYNMIAAKWLCEIVLKKPGHFEHIGKIIYTVYKKQIQKCGFNMRDYIIINTLSAIIKEFTILKTYQFDVDSYIEKVYSKNVDILGIIISYFPVFEHLCNANGKYLNFELNNKEEVLDTLYYIFDKYVFDIKYAISPYNVDDIISDLSLLSEIIGFDVKSSASSPRIALSSSSHRIISGRRPPGFTSSSSHHTPVISPPKFSSHHTPHKVTSFRTQRFTPKFSSYNTSSKKIKSKTKSKSRKSSRK